MKSVVEGIGGCCSTEPNLKRVNPSLFEWNSFRINASYNNESSHYYRCFGGCYSTGTESGKWRLFWRELDMEAVVGGIGGCCSTGAESEVWMLFWSELKNRNSFRINARVNKESRKNSSSNNTNYNRESSIVLEANLGCYSTGTESKALMFFWKKSGGYYTIGTKTGERGDSFEMKYRL
uniref:Uncharacterized protein n=1 Tax=Strongyloides stercoralis TaxID=6248 RepID=A0AAF5DE75_STRER